MEYEKMMTLLASFTLMLVVMDTVVTSEPVAETESHKSRISAAKRDRRLHRRRSPTSSSSSWQSPPAAELSSDDGAVVLDIVNSLPLQLSSTERVKSSKGRSSVVVLPRRRRHQRSVAWWLQAALRMCDESRTNGGGGGRGCKELRVNDGRHTRVEVTLEDQ